MYVGSMVNNIQSFHGYNIKNMFILFAKLLWLIYIYYFNLVKIMLSVLKYNLSSAYLLYYVLVKINNLIEPDFSFHLRGLKMEP